MITTREKMNLKQPRYDCRGPSSSQGEADTAPCWLLPTRAGHKRLSSPSEEPHTAGTVHAFLCCRFEKNFFGKN